MSCMSVVVDLINGHFMKANRCVFQTVTFRWLSYLHIYLIALKKTLHLYFILLSNGYLGYQTPPRGGDSPFPTNQLAGGSILLPRGSLGQWCLEFLPKYQHHWQCADIILSAHWKWGCQPRLPPYLCCPPLPLPPSGCQEGLGNPEAIYIILLFSTLSS